MSSSFFVFVSLFVLFHSFRRAIRNSILYLLPFVSLLLNWMNSVLIHHLRFVCLGIVTVAIVKHYLAGDLYCGFQNKKKFLSIVFVAVAARIHFLAFFWIRAFCGLFGRFSKYNEIDCECDEGVERSGEERYEKFVTTQIPKKIFRKKFEKSIFWHAAAAATIHNFISILNRVIFRCDSVRVRAS